MADVQFLALSEAGGDVSHCLCLVKFSTMNLHPLTYKIVGGGVTEMSGTPLHFGYSAQHRCLEVAPSWHSRPNHEN